MAENTPSITDFASKGYKRLIIVEGTEDAHFIYSLAKHLECDNQIWVHELVGVSKLENTLVALLQSSQFKDLEYLGIVRDSDFDTNAFSSVCSILEAANKRHTHHQYPIPKKSLELAGDELKLSILILPDDGASGMLEDLILEAFRGDDIMDCTDAYFKCLEDKKVNLKQTKLGKAKTRVFIAGKTINEELISEEDDKWEMRFIYRLSWWSWDKPIFDNAKNFLNQLAQSE